jgi:hypothetical protein
MNELIKLWQQMYELTRFSDECRECRFNYSCCSPEYCQMAMDYAAETWGETLTPTDHPRLPLMGPKGCIAPPHVRPFCTLHTCKINSMGFTNNPAWDKQYFDLRDKITELETADDVRGMGQEDRQNGLEPQYPDDAAYMEGYNQ